MDYPGLFCACSASKPSLGLSGFAKTESIFLPNFAEKFDRVEIDDQMLAERYLVYVV